MQKYFKRLFEYDKWANDAIIYRLEKQFPLNPRIYGLLSHILSAQFVWLCRCMDIPQTEALWRGRLPDEIRLDLENYHMEWMVFLDQLSPEAFDRNVHYTNTKGQEFDNRLSDILAHVINHGTHHRGSILILMKEEGFVLPGLDYIVYVR